MGKNVLTHFMIYLFLLCTGYAKAFPVTPSNLDGDVCNLNDPDFAEIRYPEKIPYCRRSVSEYRKIKIYNVFQIPADCRGKFTIDHTIPLALGGNNSNKNLWPEHKAIKALRYNLELQLYYDLAAGKVSQEDAVNMVLWAKANPPLDHIDLDPDDHCDAVSQFKISPMNLAKLDELDETEY